MGLSHSKTHPRVTKVAPLQIKEEETPSAHPVDVAFNQNLEETSSYSFARLPDRNKALEGQLPPLRETWYGRYSAVPRTMYFDIPLEQGETSIIKSHPPRRLQGMRNAENALNVGLVEAWTHQPATSNYFWKDPEPARSQDNSQSKGTGKEDANSNVFFWEKTVFT